MKRGIGLRGIGRRRSFVIGPAALVTAAFIGPGTVTTCSLAGAGFGYALLWGLLFSVIATVVLQEMSARLGIVTQHGLGEAIRRSATRPMARVLALILVLSAIVIGNAAFETGNLLGGSLGMETLTGWGSASNPSAGLKIWPLIIGALAWLLLWLGGNKILQNVLIALVILMSLAFISTALIIKPDLAAVLKGSFAPSIPAGALLTLIGLIGTTVVPYNLFLHASTAAEKWKKPSDLRASRIDIVISICLGGLISMAVMITAAVSFHGSGMILKNAADLALQLEPLLGSWARLLMAAGLFAAGFTSAITAPLAAAYAAKGILGWTCDRKDWRFRLVYSSIILTGMIFAQVGSSPVEAILFAQVANGILLPVIAGYLLWIMNRSDVLGNHRNKLAANLAGGAVWLVTLVLGLRTIFTVLRIL